MYVAADLSRVPLVQALTGTGFESSRPALFTVEGLSYYLPVDACAALFQSLSHLAVSGSRIYFDFLAAAALQGRENFPGFKVTRKVRLSALFLVDSDMKAGRPRPGWLLCARLYPIGYLPFSLIVLKLFYRK